MIKEEEKGDETVDFRDSKDKSALGGNSSDAFMTAHTQTIQEDTNLFMSAVSRTQI